MNDLKKLWLDVVLSHHRWPSQFVINLVGVGYIPALARPYVPASAGMVEVMVYGPSLAAVHHLAVTSDGATVVDNVDELSLWRWDQVARDSAIGKMSVELDDIRQKLGGIIGRRATGQEKAGDRAAWAQLLSLVPNTPPVVVPFSGLQPQEVEAIQATDAWESLRAERAHNNTRLISNQVARRLAQEGSAALRLLDDEIIARLDRQVWNSLHHEGRWYLPCELVPTSLWEDRPEYHWDTRELRLAVYDTTVSPPPHLECVVEEETPAEAVAIIA